MSLKNCQMRKITAFIFLFAILSIPALSQNLTAKESIEKADAKMRGLTSKAEIKMSIIRPTWKREMQMK